MGVGNSGHGFSVRKFQALRKNQEELGEDTLRHQKNPIRSHSSFAQACPRMEFSYGHEYPRFTILWNTRICLSLRYLELASNNKKICYARNFSFCSLMQQMLLNESTISGILVSVSPFPSHHRSNVCSNS